MYNGIYRTVVGNKYINNTDFENTRLPLNFTLDKVYATGYAIKIAGNDVEQEGEEKAGLIFADAKTAAERYAIPSAFAEYAKYTDLERA